MTLCEFSQDPAKEDDATTFVEWVGRLVLEHRSRLVRIARHEGVHGEDALDAVQEAFHTFLLLPQAKTLVDAPEECSRLLTTVVRNVARNRRRRHHSALPHTSEPSVLENVAGDMPSSLEVVQQARENMRLRGCVAALGELQRKVVMLRMLEERAGEDVAGELGISASHVAVMLYRAKRELRTCMTDG